MGIEIPGAFSQDLKWLPGSLTDDFPEAILSQLTHTKAGFLVHLIFNLPVYFVGLHSLM